MTTIAYRDGVMASDSQDTEEDDFVISIDSTKVFHLPNNSIVGMAGDTDDRGVFELLGKADIEFCERPTKEELIETRTTVDALWVWPDQRLWSVYVTYRADESEWQAYVSEIHSDYAAVGSGGKFALGAMAFGASAEEAVEVASEFDIYTGGSVQSMSVE